MQDAQVTIVVVPRERLSFAERCISSIYENTSIPFNLIYVSGGVPNQVRDYLEVESSRKGFRILIEEHFLSPNQARNLSLPHVKTKYVVFLDNDTLVMKGWLERLVRCAEETDASIVGPLYLIGEFERAIIHMAGGRLHREDTAEKRVLIDEQYLFDTPIREASMRLRRRVCDYVEFHCMLVCTEVFDRVGSMDEKLPCLHEERDFCLTISSAGGKIYIEPKAVVTYVPPPPCESWDLPYFMLRWSEAWIHSSVRHFNQKWGLASVRHISDVSNNFADGTVVGFGRAWRRRVAGTKVTLARTSQHGNRPLDQARLMIALLQSVDREEFDFARITADGDVVPIAFALSPGDLHKRLPQILSDADAQRTGVGIRPLTSGAQDAPNLVILDRLPPENMQRIRQRAFMTLEVQPDLYQCWVALDTKSVRANKLFGDMLAQCGSISGAKRIFALAGSMAARPGLRSVIAPDCSIRLLEGTVGLLNTALQVEKDMDLFQHQVLL
jgi:GT2 family glycosyltransferase